MPYKYIGRITDFKGKTLWEIIGNLKNFGVGRIVVRSKMERYPEPTYMKILKVEALANPEKPSYDDVRKVKVVMEKTFRGKTFLEPVHILSASLKADYRLLSKDEEAEYCKGAVRDEIKILPRFVDFPPLMRELIVNEARMRGEKIENPKMEVVYREQRQNKNYRLQKEGEEATVVVTAGLGIPISPNLYKNIKLQ